MKISFREKLTCLAVVTRLISLIYAQGHLVSLERSCHLALHSLNCERIEYRVLQDPRATEYRGYHPIAVCVNTTYSY